MITLMDVRQDLRDAKNLLDRDDAEARVQIKAYLDKAIGDLQDIEVLIAQSIATD